jgi:LEA14-like dessication related protein
MKKPNPTTFVLMIFVSILLLTGCAGVGKRLEPPRIQMASIRVQELTGFETVFQIKLRVFNTNDVELNVKGIEADLAINGRPFATGVSKAEVQIPAFETRLVPITVYSSIIDIFKSIRGLQQAEQLQYGLKGKLRVVADNALTASLPFESEGQVTLSGSKGLEK